MTAVAVGKSEKRRDGKRGKQDGSVGVGVPIPSYLGCCGWTRVTERILALKSAGIQYVASLRQGTRRATGSKAGVQGGPDLTESCMIGFEDRRIPT